MKKVKFLQQSEDNLNIFTTTMQPTPATCKDGVKGGSETDVNCTNDTKREPATKLVRTLVLRSKIALKPRKALNKWLRLCPTE